ncbi:molecular chaperone HtpG [Synergistaceae bacterium OttesenSCG-928-I11]|nr:molecular chaperone HtpG [Synergistaceae bacterium OttesenSCG-928-I11]
MSESETNTTHTSKQKHEFQSEAKQVLELMIHSVYSNPDIFLRELISNASDALDKLRIESLSDDTLSDCARDPKITVTVDPKERIVTIRDNGIGMSRDELVSYLGTIARSGTGEFVRAMQEAATSGRSDLIGQFGVGFYSSFIVADRVAVESRHAGSDESWLWDSTGDGTFTIEPADLEGNGTEITLYMKDKAEKDADGDDAPTKDYLSSWALRGIIKQYSDFVSYPIYLEETGKEKKDDEKSEPVNSMKAIWIRPEAEVSDDEYKEFYRHITHDWEDPLERIAYRAEGTNEFHALLYIPSHPPFDLFYREGKHGIQLYIRRVFIMSDCRDLIPEYMRFVRGVVDSEDLPLNVSREILQEDRQTAMIKRSLTRKVLDALKKMKTDDAEAYKKFWGMFGIVLKEGIVQDSRNRETILKLCLVENSRGETTTLEEYVARMKDGQKGIYYIAGGDVEALRNSPKLEAFRKRDIEVLLLGDPVDEFWVTAAGKFGDHAFVSVASADIDLPDGDAEATDEERASAKKLEDAGIAARLKEAMANLGGVAKSVEEVRLSTRLVDSPATFVQKGDPITPQMRAMFKAMGQEMPEEKRVLEINPSHPLVKRIADDAGDNYADWATLLLGVAQIADGEPIDNPAAFTKTLGKMLEK